jgi:hypothetical protein
MRYLVGSMCALALGVMPATGCTEEGVSTIGSMFPSVDLIEIEINLSYQWGEREDDEYVLDVEALTVTYNKDTMIEVAADQMSGFVETIQEAGSRVNESECFVAIDAGVLAPRIEVREGARSGTFSVSDSDCATRPNQGLVIGCDDYSAILEQLKQMAPHNDPLSCSYIW